MITLSSSGCKCTARVLCSRKLSVKRELVTMKKCVSLVLVLILLLAGCGGSDKEEPPQNYTLGESSLPALSTLVTLGDDVQFQQTED